MKFTIRRLVLLAGVPVLAVVALLAVAARTSDAQRSIDLSGSWYVTINGDSALVCTAEVVQSSGELSMNVVCPPILGDGTFTGTVDPKTGAFTTTGVLVFPVSVSGTAATDGQSFSGTWSAETSATGTFAGTRDAPLPETPSLQPTLPAPIDLSGAWRIAFPSPLLGDCTLAIHEDGTLLTAIGQCSGPDGGLRLNGTMDQTVGRLRLEEPDDFELEGTLSANGNTVTGTYQVFSRPRAAFTASRDNSIQFIDLSGDWHFQLPSDPLQECTFYIDQPFSDVSASFSCAAVSDLQIAGDVNPISGSFYLSDPNLHVENYFSGRSSTDGRYLTAELVYGSDKWRFTAVRQASDVSGLVTLSDAGQRAVGIPFHMQARVVVPPPDVFDAFQVRLAWKSEELFITSMETPDCSNYSIIITDPEHASLGCSYGEGQKAATVLVDVTLTCKRLGYATIDLSGTTLTSPDGPSVTPSVIGARIFCWTPAGSEPGDGSCDGAVNSVDAALVLQHEAGLLSITGCLALADMNFDDQINSIDAALILQHEAGLIPTLPVF